MSFLTFVQMSNITSFIDIRLFAAKKYNALSKDCGENVEYIAGLINRLGIRFRPFQDDGFSLVVGRSVHQLLEFGFLFRA